ncbi:MAG: hypothetical protein ACYDAY_01150 [Candidatus Dormibacteria bacterium]
MARRLLALAATLATALGIQVAYVIAAPTTSPGERSALPAPAEPSGSLARTAASPAPSPLGSPTPTPPSASPSPSPSPAGPSPTPSPVGPQPGPPSGCPGPQHPPFATYCVFATDYQSYTNDKYQGSEVAVPDKCAKWASLGDTNALQQSQSTQYPCPLAGYPLNLDYRVLVQWQGHSAYIPVGDDGPWNISDNYWDPAWPNYPRPRRIFQDLMPGLPEAQAAYYNGYNQTQNCTDLSGNPYSPPRNGPADFSGRCILNPAGLDIGLPALPQLGYSSAGGFAYWVTATFMWEPLVPGYVLDGWGGVNPFGGAPPVRVTGYWAGFDIARGLAVRPDHKSGYVLDGYGGVHPFGVTPPAVPQQPPYWGWDIGRAIALDPADANGASGYVLDGYGGVHPFGGAAPVTSNDYWPGFDIARALVVNPRTTQYPYVTGYVLDGYGGIHPFWQSGQPAPPPPAQSAYWNGWDIAHAMVSSGFGQGYVLDGWGGIHAFGGAPGYAPGAYWAGWDIARGITWNPAVGGGFTVDGWGGVHPFGGSPRTDPGAYWPNWDIARGLG